MPDRFYVTGNGWFDAVGYLAAGLVFATFWMKTMSALRGTRIASPARSLAPLPALG